jgi:hypothetical protein
MYRIYFQQALSVNDTYSKGQEQVSIDLVPSVPQKTGHCLISCNVKAISYRNEIKIIAMK